jgi:hypothetical protein
MFLVLSAGFEALMAAAPKMQQHKVQEGSDAHLWLQRIMNSSSNAR